MTRGFNMMEGFTFPEINEIAPNEPSSEQDERRHGESDIERNKRKP